MTIGEALRDAAVRLEPVGGGGRLDAVFLLAHAGGVSRAEMIAHRERELGPQIVRRFEELVAQRERGAPLAYVTGEAGFFGRMFGVDARVLVPRPETELAVEWAVRHLRAIGRETGSAADIGTGSGAIAVTLAAELPGLGVFASDVSQDALARRAPERGAQRRLPARHVSARRPGRAAASVRAVRLRDREPAVRTERGVRGRARSGLVRAAARARRRRATDSSSTAASLRDLPALIAPRGIASSKPRPERASARTAGARSAARRGCRNGGRPWWARTSRRGARFALEEKQTKRTLPEASRGGW